MVLYFQYSDGRLLDIVVNSWDDKQDLKDFIDRHKYEIMKDVCSHEHSFSVTTRPFITRMEEEQFLQKAEQENLVILEIPINPRYIYNHYPDI